jgi:hypothetical protein
MTRYLFVAVILAGILSISSTAGGQPLTAPTAEVTPEVGTAGNFGTWTVTVTVGPDGIEEGGSVRVQLPDSWHAGGRNSANPLQASDPGADHYVSAQSPNTNVRIETIVEGESDDVLIKSDRPGLDGRNERYVFVVRATVTDGQLTEGDQLSIIYGDTSSGSRGMQAAIISTQPEPVHVAIDATGDDSYERLSEEPTIQSRPGPPVRMRLIAPSSLTVGDTGELRVVILDEHNNLVRNFQDDLSLELFQGSGRLTGDVSLEMDEESQTVSFTPDEPGIVRIDGRTREGLLTARSNPIDVTASDPDRKTYWGDLHSHSHHSWDGVGHRPFHYARHAAGLDFYARTDHSIPPADGFTRGLADHAWEEYTTDTETHHDPGSFVTLHAYEASFGSPYGHHNVYFRGSPGPLLAPANVSLPELWEALTAGEALTIPHHTGKFPQPVHWKPQDSTFRRNFEIYSAHGLSETFDPDHPLAFEQSDFTSPSSSSTGGHAHDAWAHGLRLSTVAASDDHRSQPGQAHWGITAVTASELTRDGVFEALSDRHTYGTTGERILLDFSINGSPMGRQLDIDGPPELRIEGHGTRKIETVELLRYSPTAGSFEIIRTIEPDGLDFAWSDIDTTLRDERAIYYVRLKQQGQVRGRISMAWSSPIWVHVHD